MEFCDPPGFIRADEDHVGLDPALKTGIAPVVAAPKRCGERKGGEPFGWRKAHGLLRSPKIRSRWTRSISFASSGACRSNRLFQMIATIAGATTICGKSFSSG